MNRKTFALYFSTRLVGRRAPQQWLHGLLLLALLAGTATAALTLGGRVLRESAKTPDAARPTPTSAKTKAATKPRLKLPVSAPLAIGVNLDQWQNGVSGGAAPEWANGDINDNNSHYMEGDSVPFRVFVDPLGAGNAGPHSITIEWDFAKGGVDGYDYLSAYNWSESLASSTAGASGPCGAGSGAASPADCAPPVSVGNFPDPNTYFPPGYGGEAATTARDLFAYNVAPGSVSFSPYNFVGTASDATVSVTISFTAADPTRTVGFFWGGHLAKGTSKAWGMGKGIGSLSGAPMHMAVPLLDGDKVGNEDRSIHKVLVCSPPPATITPDVAGPYCPGSTHTASAPAGAAGYTWGITGGTITSGQGTNSITYSVTAACKENVVLTLAACASATSPGCCDTGTLEILVNDTTLPVLSGVPEDTTAECNAIPAAPTVTATDNCDAKALPVKFEESKSGTCPTILTRTWSATDACGNTATKTQTIKVVDTVAPVLSAQPADYGVQCRSDVLPAEKITANDVCAGAVTVTFSETESNPGSSCNNVITRIWSARDSCDNPVSWTQKITVNDTTAPDISAFPSAGVEVCLGSLVVVPSLTATDKCSGDVPVIYIRSDNNTLKVTDPFPVGVTTVTASAVDKCGNKSVERVFTVTVRDCLLGLCSYTQGGWGATPQGNNPAKQLSSNFSGVFGSGLVVGIGNSMTFTSAKAVENYLPAGGTPSVLTSSSMNPTTSSAGVFGGQVLALKINVGMSAASKINFGYGNLIYTGPGSLNGSSVSQILAALEQALGGGGLPPGYTIADLNALATNLNEAFDNCRATSWAITNLRRP